MKRLHINRRALIALLIVIMVLMTTSSAFAQTSTPTTVPPTATPGLTVNTTVLFSQINTWVTSLDDIIFLGIAIAIAIALLTFIGNQILKAFKGGGAR